MMKKMRLKAGAEVEAAFSYRTRVAGPLKRTDCSLVSDGAAAVVLADVGTALKLGKAVAFRAAEHVQDFLPMSKRDVLKLEGCGEAWKRGIRIGSAKDGSVTAFIPDPDANPSNTSAAEGVAVDARGNIYGAEVGPRALKRYVKP